MTIDRALILVLNYNGQGLLAECLPSILEAARHSRVPCGVAVIDNASTDGSRALLAQRWPEVGVIPAENRGLASFNTVLRERSERVVLLLNNDIKLKKDAIGPLLAAFDEHPDALFSAPLCWTFDGLSYEGMRTRVHSRFGLVQGMCRVPGYVGLLARADLTAAAGPILAVDRLKFLSLGGYDPIFFPGRIEDLDLGFRGWMAGFKGYYAPDSVAYHRGFGTFEPELGAAVCEHLAVRNSLIFAWKNLAGPRLLSHLCWLPVRLAYWVARGRWEQARAVIGALARLRSIRTARRGLGVGRGDWRERQEAFFDRFAW